MKYTVVYKSITVQGDVPAKHLSSSLVGSSNDKLSVFNEEKEVRKYAV